MWIAIEILVLRLRMIFDIVLDRRDNSVLNFFVSFIVLKVTNQTQCQLRFRRKNH